MVLSVVPTDNLLKWTGLFLDTCLQAPICKLMPHVLAILRNSWLVIFTDLLLPFGQRCFEKPPARNDLLEKDE